VLLQPTSPLRSAKQIVMGLDKFSNEKFNLVISVTEANSTVLKWGFMDAAGFHPISKPEYCFTNRQQLPSLVRPNGAIYVFSADDFLNRGGFPSTQIGALHMSAEESLDIDTLDDFKRCEAALELAEISRSI
jgi:N-acylneuraminate cytidylyltransferase